MARIFQLPKQVPIVGGSVSPAAEANFYLTGTTTPTNTYTDAALTTPHANPVVADAAGVFAVIYLDPDVVYRLVLNDSTGSLIYDEDPIQDALTQANIGLIFYPQNAAEIASGVTPTNFFEYYGNVLRYGTNTTPGTTDMRTALFDADSVGPVTIPSGIYFVGSNLTFTERAIFEPGAILQPALTVVITFDKFPDAHPSEQIFDLSVADDGTAIAWPTYDRYGVPAAWFGAIPGSDVTKSDQDVEINYAIDSLGVRGGDILLAHGDYFCTDRIQVQENVTLKGVMNRGTNIRVSSSWSDTFDHLVLFQDGATTTSMFNSRLEDITLDAENDAVVDRVIWARAWNEHCGLRNVLIRNYMQDGLYISDYYGGAATAELDSVEFFNSTSATASVQTGIRLIDPSYTSGWFQMLVGHVVFSGNDTNGKTNFFGISADGRVRVINRGGCHAERCVAICALSGASSFAGIGPQATGNGGVLGVDDIFQLSTTWDAGDGHISCTPPEIGGASGFVINNLGNEPDISVTNANPLVYPLVDTRTDAGAVSLTRENTLIVTTIASALTLADGYEGQPKYIVMQTDAGDATLTPTNFRDGTTITFNDVGDDANLKFVDGNWNFISGSATVA